MGKYNDFEFYGFTEDLLQSRKLEKLVTDSENWLIFYKNQECNWIEFYPFSEYHGGGAPYIINIGTNDFNAWLKENEDFVDSVRKLINSKVQ